MTLPEISSREKWLAARKDLLAREKELTRQRDALNAARRQLPMVEIEKDYVFTGPDGEVRLADLFGECQQLVIQHVMFDPSWDTTCPGCTASLDEIGPGLIRHIRSRDTAFAGVSRAPYPKLEEVKRARSWSLDWYSSYGTDFNYDFNVTLDETVLPQVYNFQTPEEEGEDPVSESTEVGGMSCFLRDGDRIFHTYSTYARGTDHLVGAYSVLDLTAFGRSEEWEQPKGRVAKPHGADPTFTD